LSDRTTKPFRAINQHIIHGCPSSCFQHWLSPIEFCAVVHKEVFLAIAGGRETAAQQAEITLNALLARAFSGAETSLES